MPPPPLVPTNTTVRVEHLHSAELSPSPPASGWRSSASPGSGRGRSPAAASSSAAPAPPLPPAGSVSQHMQRQVSLEDVEGFDLKTSGFLSLALSMQVVSDQNLLLQDKG